MLEGLEAFNSRAALDSAEPFGPESFDPELTTEGLTTEGLTADGLVTGCGCQKQEASSK